MLRVMSVLAALALPLGAAAHEFWIDMQGWEVAEGGDLVADLRVGEKLVGPSYSFLPQNFKRFEIVMGGTTTPVAGRAGDKPALNMAAPDDGLAVVVHETRDYSITYRDWDKFENFVTHKGVPELTRRHRDRGLPEDGFREGYTRYGKALVAVGDGTGSDVVTGMETEIVALRNPYTDDLSGGLPVRVLYRDAPRPDAQVELFERAPDGTVDVTLYETDAEGIAILPVKPGHIYLADAVVIRPVEPTEDDPSVWQSLWASLTFRVPD